jgi:hypothetical protein
MTLPSELELQRAVVIAVGGNARIADGQQARSTSSSATPAHRRDTMLI